MKQLTMSDILELCKKLQAQGLDLKEIPVYLGDDDEMNGVHNGWYCELIERSDEDINELINENYGTTPLKDKGVLIS